MKEKLFKKLSDRYRLIIYNDTTFQSVWSMKLTRLKVFTVTSLLSALIVVLVILLIATTGLREYIPGYPRSEYRQMMVESALKLDSLENELEKRDKFFNGIQAILEGETPGDQIAIDSTVEPNQVDFHEYNHDSVFQDKLLAEQTSLSLGSGSRKNLSLSQIHFFLPVKGVVSNHFNSSAEHFGVDLVGEPNSRISSVLDGTVIFSGWTIETGYVIYIQHDAELISVYKHNAELLKKVGDRVRAGEAIAIIGNTGEQTTGPHLHFELWHDGTAVNPAEYIDF
ncbi:Peptidase family M23 [Tangfeifania diversioriginum]|uniref:Peptidase family M23 n=1 Tax=Tangfeifania diversioriginum TaxID=1168035 RepID=A0A1M6GJ72_9BACT|nr:M23 family metallopeptidase [Tangfeifania diversioriginum]SHJ09994.1 Peptidase family M23 [Tangfeifania diversioriginum]